MRSRRCNCRARHDNIDFEILVPYKQWVAWYHYDEKLKNAVGIRADEIDRLLGQIRQWETCLKYYKEAEGMLRVDRKIVQEKDQVDYQIKRCRQGIEDVEKVIDGLKKVLYIARK